MALAWERFAPPPGWTRSGAEWRGCCPVTGEGRTRAWAAPWPAALRWLPADAFADVRPRPPDGAAGCIVYALTARDRPTGLQLEAVAADGAALRFAGAGKRPSVRGSRMRGAVFVARPGAAGAGVWLAESALDALAVLALALPPADVAVLAAAGGAGACDTAPYRPTRGR